MHPNNVLKQRCMRPDWEALELVEMLSPRARHMSWDIEFVGGSAVPDVLMSVIGHVREHRKRACHCWDRVLITARM